VSAEDNEKALMALADEIQLTSGMPHHEIVELLKLHAAEHKQKKRHSTSSVSRVVVPVAKNGSVAPPRRLGRQSATSTIEDATVNPTSVEPTTQSQPNPSPQPPRMTALASTNVQGAGPHTSESTGPDHDSVPSKASVTRRRSGSGSLVTVVRPLISEEDSAMHERHRRLLDELFQGEPKSDEVVVERYETFEERSKRMQRERHDAVASYLTRRRESHSGSRSSTTASDSDKKYVEAYEAAKQQRLEKKETNASASRASAEAVQRERIERGKTANEQIRAMHARDDKRRSEAKAQMEAEVARLIAVEKSKSERASQSSRGPTVNQTTPSPPSIISRVQPKQS